MNFSKSCFKKILQNSQQNTYGEILFWVAIKRFPSKIIYCKFHKMFIYPELLRNIYKNWTAQPAVTAGSYSRQLTIATLQKSVKYVQS